MKKIAFIFFLLLGPPCFAQQQSINANLTAQDSGACTTNGACLVLPLAASSGSAVINLSGTFSGTIQFEGTVGGTWFSVGGIPASGGSSVTSSTGTGAWRVTASGLSSVRVRVSTFSSGTIVVVITSGPGASASTSTSGGSVSEVDTSAPITGGPITSSGTIGLTVGTGCTSGSFSTGTDSLLNSNCSIPPTGGGGTPPYVGPTAVNGCGVEWTGLLTFTVGQCTYIINGITYSSAITNLTLAAADATNPRIDAIIVDNTGTASAITGTPAGSPVDPTTDPSTQLALTFVEVAANATTPTGITSETIYDENVEWNTTKGGTNSARVALASTNNPYRGSVDMEFGVGGTVTTTTFAEATKPSSATENLSTWNFLVFYIRNKAAWPTNRSVTIQWYNGATAVGTGIVLNNNNFGFNATTNVTTYQQIIIPTSYFGTAANAVTSIRWTVSGTGAALTGFYIDAVSLQAGTAPTPPLPTTLMNWRGTYSSAVQYNPNDTVVLNGCYFVALASNLNVAVSTTSTWTGVGSCATAKTGQILTAVNGAPSNYLSPGVPPRAVSTGTDTILCDSTTALRDRGGWVLYTDASGATVTVPDAGSTGCANNFLVGVGAGHGAGTITFNRTTSSQFYVLNGGSAAAGATSFTLTAGQYATIKTDPDTTDWDVTITAGAGAGTVTSVVIAGTSNQIAVSGTCTITTTGTCTVAFPSTIVVPSGSTATTQSACDNSTKVATTAYVGTVCNTVETSGSPLTISAQSQTLWNNTSGAYVGDLPTPSASGPQVCIGNYKTVAHAVSFVPGTGITIYYKGVAGTTSSSTGLVSGGAAGDFICVEGVDSTTYIAIGAGYGTWTNN